MATKSSSQKPQEAMAEKAREIWLAGLGVFSTIEEEGEKLFNKFMEKGKELESKGETFEKKAKDKVSSVTSYVSERTSKLSDEVTAKVNETMPVIEEKFRSVLQSFGFSSRSEVKALADKVDKLTETVAALTKKLEEAGKMPPKPKAKV